MQEAKGYTKYNFDRPDKFSFEHIRSLDSIFSIFSRNFATDLSGYIRVPVEIEVGEIEQIPFQTEYISKIKRDEHVLCITDLDKEQFIIQLDVGFLLQVHSKQLGGEFGEIKKTTKNITEFEMLTASQLIEEHFLPYLKDSFRTIKEVDFKLSSVESDPQYARVTLPQDMVALINLKVFVDGQTTTIKVLLPYLSIEGLIERLNTDTILKDKKMITPKEQLGYLYNQMLKTKRDVIVNLGKKNIPMKEINELSKGDVIVLGEIQKELELSVDKKVKAYGKIGTKDGKYAVKINRIIKKKDTDEEKKMKLNKVLGFSENAKEG